MQALRAPVSTRRAGMRESERDGKGCGRAFCFRSARAPAPEATPLLLLPAHRARAAGLGTPLLRLDLADPNSSAERATPASEARKAAPSVPKKRASPSRPDFTLSLLLPPSSLPGLTARPRVPARVARARTVQTQA